MVGQLLLTARIQLPEPGKRIESPLQPRQIRLE